MADVLPFTPLQTAHMLLEAGFTGWPVATMGAICRAESGLNAYAINVVEAERRADGSLNPAYRSIDVGIGQINTYWFPTHRIQDLLDPLYNLSLCRRIYLEAGQWSAGYSRWNVYKTGAHLPYAQDAINAARAAGVAI